MFIYARKFIVLIVLLTLTACGGQEDIVVQTPAGEKVAFTVAVAKTPEEQQKGLMFVEEMPMAQGMIFVYPQQSIAKFWMKNTLIPLDILFFDATNTLIHIEASARPGDLNPRGPDVPICSVLEINGGQAQKLGLNLGSKLITNFAQQCLQSSNN